jgi:UDP-N-acetylglucosamine 2-epimerase (non-hydrolysing)
MSKKKIMIVFGTRPEAIKMAPLYHALNRRKEIFEVICCVSAQHRHMLDQVLETFGITPDVDLDLMKAGQDLYDVTSGVLLAMRDVLREVAPDFLLVHGDTTTTMASAMAAFYAGIPVGHVEAGLRTFDLAAPFPEEFNRQIAGKIARYHFAPTKRSEDHLLAEGVRSDAITVTGNTVIDALQLVLEQIDATPSKRAQVETTLDAAVPFAWREEPFVLITGHRRENFGEGFENICSALAELSRTHPEMQFLYPVHLNPNVRTPVKRHLSDLRNVHLIEPLTYEPFLVLLRQCRIVLTDSGGIQEEAPSLGKPVLVMRDRTERPEAVEAGTVELVGADHDRIVDGVSRLITDEAHYQRMAHAYNPYGDGKACERIVSVLENLA